jgi:transposase InsO family protein
VAPRRVACPIASEPGAQSAIEARGKQAHRRGLLVVRRAGGTKCSAGQVMSVLVTSKARTMRDAFSNKVVGCDSGPRAPTELVCSALDYAIFSRDVCDGQLIHHSDQGLSIHADPVYPAAARRRHRAVDRRCRLQLRQCPAENLWSSINV